MAQSDGLDSMGQRQAHSDSQNRAAKHQPFFNFKMKKLEMKGYFNSMAIRVG